MTATRRAASPSRSPGAIVALGLAALPSVLSGLRAVTGRWTPVIDNGVISARATDAWQGHPPLTGIYTSLTEAAHWPHRLHHLGPIEFWVMAPVQRLFGPDGVGLAIGAACINALAAAGVVWLVRRTAGRATGWLALVVVVVLSWSLGGQVLHDPWNPHLAVVPCLFVLAAGWAVAAGDLRILPLFAFAASAVMQLHLTFVPPVALVVVVAGVGLAVAVRTGRTAGRSSLRKWLAAALVVAVATWSGPIIDLVAGDHNLWGVARASGGAVPRLGLGSALRGLVHATAIPPVWWHSDNALVAPEGPVSVWQAVSALLVVAGLIALAWRAWRAERHVEAAALVVALAALAGTTATVARTPAGFGYQELLWARRVWWSVASFAWIAGVVAVRREIRSRERTPAAGWLPWAAGAVSVAIVVVAWPRLGVQHDFGSAGFGPVRSLSRSAAAATSGGGVWAVQAQGEFARAIVWPGVAAELAARGRDVRVPGLVSLDMGDRHRLLSTTRVTGTVLLVSGAAQPAARTGFRLVGRWDPARAPEPYRSYHATMFLVPVQPIAVYVRVGGVRYGG